MKKFKFNIEGTPYEVDILSAEGNVVELDVNGKAYKVELDEEVAAAKPAAAAPRTVAQPAVAPVAAGGGATHSVKSPLPGSVLRIELKEGAVVKAGDVLLVMESMKMENNITSEFNGVVKKVAVAAGQTVMQDDLLVEIVESGVAVAAAPAPKPTAAPAPAPKPAEAPKPAPAPASGGAARSIKSPLPGSILKIEAKVGAAVKEGDVLLVMESMKMENNITSEYSGVVKSIAVAVGQTVMQDDLLVEIG
jgi:biotin carboxyl carrier protein